MEQDKQKQKKPQAVKPPENLMDEYGVGTKKTSPPKTEISAPEVKQKAASDKIEPPTEKKASSEQGARKKEETSEAKKAKESSKEAPKGSAKKASKEKEEVKASTASPKKEKAKDSAPAVDLDSTPRSARPAHRAIPYILMVFAVLIGVSLLLNLFCNRGNILENTPQSHLMGVVGYHICYVLFGVFGPAVFALPILLVNLAFFWRRYIDNKLAISKIAVSVLFLLLLGAVIHVFCLLALEPAQRDLTVSELMKYGARMTGGGVLGGLLGAFLVKYLNFIGALILGILLMLVSMFYFLGMTPEHLWEHIRTQKSLKRERALGVSERDAEAAHNKARMDEKIRRTTARQMTIDDEQVKAAPEGAVEITEKIRPKKNTEDKLAPMPVPHLNPGTDNRLFVPTDVNRKLREADRNRASVARPASPAQAAQQQPAAKPAAATSTPASAPAPNPAQNRDAAVEPIFPKTTDPKQVRRVPKEDRNFDLGKVFLDLDDHDNPPARNHAPVPPEVPMTAAQKASRPAGQSPAKPVQPAARQTPPARPAVQPTPATPTTRPAPTSGRAPSLAAVKPAMPGISHPITPESKEFGLTSEEFEKLEAGRVDIRKAPEKEATAKKATSPAKSSEESKKNSETKPAAKAAAPKKYVFPPISYLQPGVPMTEENRAEIEASKAMLHDTLESFHVRVQGINYSCGPTVTRYEVVLAPGVRVRTVTNLADDIALSLRSSGGVRIEGPIPGTNAVGIEVPNKTRSTIYLRDLIESKEFATAKSKLSACLGADIAGHPIIFDIARMPHLLVAGTTGSGKSVCINCIIMSLLYKVRPDEVKLVLIDPKKVEFSIYKNIPHLMAPVVTQPKDAAGALQAAVEEMERRFEMFETVGVRDLKGYNEVTKDDPDMPFIPHMVIIIDELADLMMTAKNEVETAICRIAQKARAAGMHLIIGTQRPSADVVTGLIKANVPSSIAFAVKSQIDSRVILDHGGAEALTGRGDMLFVPIGAMRDTRIQGAFVDDKEVEKICEFIRVTNGTAQYDEKFTAKLKELAAQCGNKGKGADDAVPMGADGEKGDDPKYADAVRVAIEEKRVATSLLQRKLGVGYSRAAKLIDRMQSEGIVSAPDGSKPRAILITPEEYLARFVDNGDANGEKQE
ncbi:MAG: DNA translocase FtsK 4TM domain-containing protein [Clostridia bacterium]|nr:DNA translocase FtsK 4TM domain-containing protein [Clostridia bacterium]